MPESAVRRCWPLTRIFAAGGCTYGIVDCGRVANVIPVNVAIPDCPPPPLEILRGILSAVSHVNR